MDRNIPGWIRIAALAAAGFTLLVLGAALRPLMFAENHTAAPILDTVEVGFAQDMTAHHQQALQMVQRLDPAAGAPVRRLAQQLADTQRMEIGTMLGWLRLANAAPMSSRPMAWMHTEPAASHHHSPEPTSTTTPAATTMPGMATMAELDALATAKGRAAEILFLQLMIRHHEGGTAMTKAADELLQSGPVKEAARSMFQAQSQEIGVMSVILTQLKP
ncbi:DUF305 domain-containing protein [Nocardia sp. XZ_19_385]|uniref:DUF305 domain-containing protein n=1 Tax=Nocardia sp. XZ_19_385 TaxID=2769488 RepID=UPI00281563B5|nr:DUF305 domain-containing protein [Nocardia sp. XZ_19_385]